ncbi:uncharacterized protein LOC117728642 [Cyclopterus lumpus]|uniref:uncharacterized protein LOC117728642 n=1 Tax=Cyclopterus lumpus TaxID=8103 RepID=UPI0014861584|nr:uncharacterized protein LOC117728642 [Cyclopterus lumpus]
MGNVWSPVVESSTISILPELSFESFGPRHRDFGSQLSLPSVLLSPNEPITRPSSAPSNLGYQRGRDFKLESPGERHRDFGSRLSLPSILLRPKKVLRGFRSVPSDLAYEFNPWPQIVDDAHQIIDAPVDAHQIIDAPVDAPQILDAPVDAPQILDAPVDAPQILDAPVDAPQILDAPVDAPQILDAPVDAPPAHKWDELSCYLLVTQLILSIVKDSVTRISPEDMEVMTRTLYQKLWVDMQTINIAVQPKSHHIEKIARAVHKDLCTLMGDAEWVQRYLLLKKEEFDQLVIQTLKTYLVKAKSSCLKRFFRAVVKPFTCCCRSARQY